jgi:hypothetical protein
MPTTLPSQRGIDSAAVRAMPTADATLHLSAHTLSWLAKRPVARALVDSPSPSRKQQPVTLCVSSPRFGLCCERPRQRYLRRRRRKDAVRAWSANQRTASRKS